MLTVGTSLKNKEKNKECLLNWKTIIVSYVNLQMPNIEKFKTKYFFLFLHFSSNCVEPDLKRNQICFTFIFVFKLISTQLWVQVANMFSMVKFKIKIKTKWSKKKIMDCDIRKLQRPFIVWHAKAKFAISSFPSLLSPWSFETQLLCEKLWSRLFIFSFNLLLYFYFYWICT